MARAGKGKEGSRQIMFADGVNTMYAQIVAPLGQGQFSALCADGLVRSAKVRGRDYKRVWIQPNDMVLLSLRGEGCNRADIELKYLPKEVKVLKDNGYIGDSFACTEITDLKIDFDQI